MKLQKPFLKWVGGKTQIIKDVLDKFPKEMNNYHEPFLGGGSVLLAVLTLLKNGQITIKGSIYASDFNKELIQVYKSIKSNKEQLYECIMNYMNDYDSIIDSSINRKPKNIEEAKTSKESYYYWLRNKFNVSTSISNIEKSALFMILNKLCFRGLYRIGPNGFNVPYGHYKNTPNIISKKDLDDISELFKDVIFEHNDFNISLNNVTDGDFVYLDPPYAPETNKSFLNYTKEGFDTNTNKQLFERIKNLNEIGAKFVMSNSKVDLVTSSFIEYNQIDIIARRAINSKNPKSTTMEIIIHN